MAKLTQRELAALIFLEEYDCDMTAERNGEVPKWRTHEEGAKELLSRLDKLEKENHVRT